MQERAKTRMQWYNRTTIAAADLNLYEKNVMGTTVTRKGTGPVVLSSMEDTANPKWAAGPEKCPDCRAAALVPVNEYGIFHCMTCDNRFSMGVTARPFSVDFHGDN